MERRFGGGDGEDRSRRRRGLRGDYDGEEARFFRFSSFFFWGREVRADDRSDRY